MLTAEQNARLTQTGPGTPMGRFMRWYWLPCFLSWELEAGGEPKATQLLSERLVGFRAPDGSVGILHEFCPHRRVSLAYARNEPEGLRCIYHGWQINHRGEIVDTPAEPPGSKLKEKIRHLAYPCREAGGTIWVYLGPPPPPPFIRWPWMDAPEDSRDITKVLESCNWLQGLEGSLDSAHSDYLHRSHIRGRPSDRAPRLVVEDMPYGFRYAAIRNPDHDPDRLQHVRITLFRYPFHCFIPPQRRADEEIVVHQAWVPVDDEHNYFFSFRYNRRGRIREPHHRQFALDAAFRPRRRRENKHLQDREAMRQGHWSGITSGVNSEDLAVIESGEPIFDRTKEHLGASDVAIIHLRRLLLQALQATEAGIPPGDRELSVHPWRAEEGVIPRQWPWQRLVEPEVDPEKAQSTQP